MNVTEFKETDSHADSTIEYDIKSLTLYEQCLSGAIKEADVPTKRIKNISNSIWKIIYTMIMKGNKPLDAMDVSSVPLNEKNIKKYKEITDQEIIMLKEKILALGNVFADQYKTLQSRGHEVSRR